MEEQDRRALVRLEYCRGVPPYLGDLYCLDHLENLSFRILLYQVIKGHLADVLAFYTGKNRHGDE